MGRGGGVGGGIAAQVAPLVWMVVSSVGRLVVGGVSAPEDKLSPCSLLRVGPRSCPVLRSTPRGTWELAGSLLPLSAEPQGHSLQVIRCPLNSPALPNKAPRATKQHVPNLPVTSFKCGPGNGVRTCLRAVLWWDHILVAPSAACHPGSHSHKW